MAARAPAFVHNALFTELVGHRLNLFEIVQGVRFRAGNGRIEILGIPIVMSLEKKALQQVRAGPVHLGKEMNVTWGGVGARPVVFKIVAGRGDSVPRAPIGYRTSEVFKEQVVQRIVKIKTGRSAGRRRKIQIGEFFLERVSPAPAKLVQHQWAAVLALAPWAVGVGG